MTAVARGAAIYAASLDGELGDDSDFSLVTSYDLGTAVSAGAQRGFRAIIRRNATLPAEGSANFYPDTPGASFVRVPVIEGEVGYPANSDRAFPLANIEVKLPTREQDIRRNRIEIKFRYNESGILRFTATHAETGVVLAEREIDSFGPDGTPLAARLGRRADPPAGAHRPSLRRRFLQRPTPLGRGSGQRPPRTDRHVRPRGGGRPRGHGQR